MRGPNGEAPTVEPAGASSTQEGVGEPVNNSVPRETEHEIGRRDRDAWARVWRRRIEAAQDDPLATPWAARQALIAEDLLGDEIEELLDAVEEQDAAEDER